jgi:hypothetical protein
MFKYLTAPFLFAFAAAWISPAGAQTPGTRGMGKRSADNEGRSLQRGSRAIRNSHP